MSHPGYIYLINAKTTNFYKIGFTTRTPEERLNELNGKQSPHENVLVHSVWVDECRDVESQLHRDYELYHYRKEWFKFSSFDVTDVINAMDGYKYSQPNYINTRIDSSDSITPFIFLAILLGIYFLTTTFFKPLTKYSDCLRHQGGQACQKLIKK
jgi:predicted GIY-YIG superfamily endonuclease